MSVMVLQYEDAVWPTSMSMGVDELFEPSVPSDQ